ncbi:MAG: low molecular weight protein arginine phosphatase [Gemmatimonadetes bacterium]|nr:low molecular weight protein arginine phosphatase [Gemmatimonadota bacterium]MDA1104328.1 low molecular weight protein arginine phosphatase [Gemmatimonadota bacterium]
MNSLERDRPFRLLFVCTGNTCRSPMAEVIARQRFADLGWSVEVGSAGVAAFHGSPASAGAVRAASAHGLDLSGHQATVLTREGTAAADLVLTMSASHLHRVEDLGGGERGAMITTFAGASEKGQGARGVPDPVGGTDEEYQETFDFLSDLIDGVLERLRPMIQP